MTIEHTVETKRGLPTRYLILLIIFIVTAVNYADRATLSIAGTEVAKELQLDSVSMGYIFSAFGWAYLLMQIPGGWLLDRFGSKKSLHHGVCFSGRSLPSCKVSSTSSRLHGPGCQCSSCALCWASLKRLHSPANARIVAAGSRQKSAVLPRRFLTLRSTFHWRCSRRCWAG